MDIIAKLKPLYNDLEKIGLTDFMKDDEFVRICNELEITDDYAKAHNAVASATDKQYGWLGVDLTSYSDILATLLEDLYINGQDRFLIVVSQLVAKYIPHCYFISSIKEFRRDLLSFGATPEQLKSLDLAWQKEELNIEKKVRVLKNLTIARATGGFGDEEHYQAIRSFLIKNENLKSFLPEFIIKNRTTQEFWYFIKPLYGTYAERRYFLQGEFERLLDKAASISDSSPHREIIPEIAAQINEQYINDTWAKALKRLNDDPEAAITSARALIELVCKHILDDLQTVYDDGADLPKLYKLTATKLNLSPDQHTQQLFKQILSGCQSVIEGLGGLRNKLSDAHGIGRTKARPAHRHAALAVNLSGSMCSFLLQTYIHLQEKKNSEV